MTVVFIVIPLYGQSDGSHIFMVNLLSLTDRTRLTDLIYWGLFLLIIGTGIAKFLWIYLEQELQSVLTSKWSLIISAVAICLFAAAREPYVTVLLFLFFAMKLFVLWKQVRTK